MACTLNLSAESYSHIDLPTSHSVQQVSPERIKLSYESSLCEEGLQAKQTWELSGNLRQGIACWGRDGGRLGSPRVYQSVDYLCRLEIALPKKKIKGNLFRKPCNISFSASVLGYVHNLAFSYWKSICTFFTIVGHIYLYKLVSRNPRREVLQDCGQLFARCFGSLKPCCLSSQNLS